MGTCIVAFLGCYLVPIHASEANHAAGHTCSPRNRPHLLATQPRNRPHLLATQRNATGPTCSPRSHATGPTCSPCNATQPASPARHATHRNATPRNRPHLLAKQRNASGPTCSPRSHRERCWCFGENPGMSGPKTLQNQFPTHNFTKSHEPARVPQKFEKSPPLSQSISSPHFGETGKCVLK